MTRHTLIALALFGFSLSTIPGCNEQESTQTQAQEVKVKTATIRTQQVTDYGEWFGYLRGKQDTDIHPRVSGFLIAQEYSDGQFVKQGDVLFRIDPALFEAELAQAEANLQAAQAELASAIATRDQLKRDTERYEALARSAAVSEKDLSDVRHNYRAAEANVAACEARIEQQKAAVSTARINLDYTVIRAPYDGVMSTALASRGDLVSSATKLANITAINPMRVDISINSDGLVNSFRRYGNVQSDRRDESLTSPNFDIILEDGSVYPYQGNLLSMESTVSSTGLIDVEGEVENPDAALRGGMPVRVKIPLRQMDAMLVPQEAIRSVLRNYFIIVVDKNNIPHTVPVNIAGRYDITITEDDGYTTTAKLVAISDSGRPLMDYFKECGYENATEVPVVADPTNGVRAMNISSANSRLAADDPTPRGTVATEPFSFRPTLTETERKALEQATSGEKPEVNTQVAASLPAYPVKVTPLLRQDVLIQEEWYGTLRGEEEAEIRPRVSGFLLQQHFRNGTIVKEGDVLYTIDPAPYQAALDQARANLLAAKASREQAQAKLDSSREELERCNRLAPGTVSDKVVTDARTSVQTNEAAVMRADANIAQMEAAVRLAEINLNYTTIRAPFDGRVGISKPSIGELVSSSSQEPLVTLSSINPIRVDFSVSGREALQSIEIMRRNQAEHNGRVQFDLVLRNGAVYPAKGEIVSMDNTLSTTTGTFGLVGRVENVDQGLRSGMPVRVRASMAPIKDAFLVPARAPMNAGGRDLLLLLRPDNTPAALPVTLGKLVVLPIQEPGENGQPGPVVNQPMYVVDVDRASIVPLMLAKTGASSLDAMILGGAEVDSWDALVLKNAGVADWRALLEKQAGESLPDDYPQQEQAEDWRALVLRRAGVQNAKELVLRQSGAKDELELVARGAGFSSAMEMMLKQMEFTDMNNVPVIVEGTLMAASRTLQKNSSQNTRANTLTPIIFHYQAPQTVVDSVTADTENAAPQYK